MIVDMAKKEKLFASQGGPIIIAQVYPYMGCMPITFLWLHLYFLQIKTCILRWAELKFCYN